MPIFIAHPIFGANHALNAQNSQHGKPILAGHLHIWAETATEKKQIYL